MSPTPPGRTPQQERLHQSARMFAAYNEACQRQAYESDDAAMRRHCSVLLTRALGQPVEIVSRSRMTTEQLQICADWFSAGHDLAELDVVDAEYTDEPRDADPFEGQ